jgi:hypothetical protein
MGLIPSPAGNGALTLAISTNARSAVGYALVDVFPPTTTPNRGLLKVLVTLPGKAVQLAPPSPDTHAVSPWVVGLRSSRSRTLVVALFGRLPTTPALPPVSCHHSTTWLPT